MSSGTSNLDPFASIPKIPISVEKPLKCESFTFGLKNSSLGKSRSLFTEGTHLKKNSNNDSKHKSLFNIAHSDILPGTFLSKSLRENKASQHYLSPFGIHNSNKNLTIPKFPSSNNSSFVSDCKTKQLNSLNMSESHMMLKIPCSDYSSFLYDCNTKQSIILDSPKLNSRRKLRKEYHTFNDINSLKASKDKEDVIINFENIILKKISDIVVLFDSNCEI